MTEGTRLLLARVFARRNDAKLLGLQHAVLRLAWRLIRLELSAIGGEDVGGLAKRGLLCVHFELALHAIVDWDGPAHFIRLCNRGTASCSIALELLELLLSAVILLMLASTIIKRRLSHVLVGQDLQPRRRRPLSDRLLLLSPAHVPLVSALCFFRKCLETLALLFLLIATLLSA